MEPTTRTGAERLTAGLLDALEVLVNRTLELDEFTLAALRGLSGKTIAIELRDTRIRFFLTLHEGGIRLAGVHEGKTDVTIRGSPSNVLRYLLASRKGGTAGDLEISGDVALARDLHEIFAGLEPDWEEALSRRIGDTAARKLSVLFQSTRTAAREARHSLAMDISEYLRFEKQMVPERSEVERFLSAIDVLRDDVARLKFRLDRLARRGDA